MDIEYEAERGRILMNGLLKELTDDSERLGLNDLRLETIAIVGIVAWTDDEGNTRESPASFFETSRHYIKVGILTDLLREQVMRAGHDNG